MFTGHFLAFAGVVLPTLNLIARPSPLIIPTQAPFARREEEGLAARFGEDSRAHAAIAGRFWPRWRRGRG